MPQRTTPAQPDFARDAVAGLSKPGQKELPSMYLYDEIGTALFEAITLLPEYGLTRADERLLRRYRGSILDLLPSPLIVAELGSGSGRKTRLLLEELARRQPVLYCPIDVSRSALNRCRFEMAALGSVGIVGLEESYLEGLEQAIGLRAPGQTLLVLFLGSTIGNFERSAAVEFLSSIRRRLDPGDALLLGADLEKPVEQLLLAYDDPAGLTAAFNLNLLGRINRELGADFQLRQFTHQAIYNNDARRIEMHLRSNCRQTASIREADFIVSLDEGETIWTEACYKYSLDDLAMMAALSGFVPRAQWVDPEWPFAESLWVADERRC